MHFIFAPLNAFNNSLRMVPRGDHCLYTRSSRDRTLHCAMAITQIIMGICIIVNAICMAIFKFFLANVCAGFWCPVFFITSGILGLLFTVYPMPKFRLLSLISCLFNLGIFYMVVILVGMVGAAADEDVPINKVRIVPHMLNMFLGLCGFMSAFIQSTTVGWKTKEERHNLQQNQQLDVIALGANASRHQGLHTSLHVPEGHMAARPITPRSPVLSSYRSPAVPLAGGSSSVSETNEQQDSTSAEDENNGQLYEHFLGKGNHEARQVESCT